MHLRRALLLGFALATAGAASEAPAPPGMRLVPGGRYDPFYPVKNEQPTPVAPFYLDALPVTNAQLLEFKCVEFVEEVMYGELRKKPTTPAPAPQNKTGEK